MARALDVHALSGRTLGAVLDEIAHGWADWGFGPRGPFGLPIWSPGDPPLSTAELQAGAEIRRRLAPIIEKLRDGVVEIVSIVGIVPREVWFSRRWTVRYAVERGVWLEVWDEAGRKTEHDAPRFAVPGQPAAANKKPDYGEFSLALRDALTTYAKELAGIKFRTRRAAFLAQKIGCSKSLAYQILKGEGK